MMDSSGEGVLQREYKYRSESEGVREREGEREREIVCLFEVEGEKRVCVS